MASVITIVNAALTLLGESRIISLDQDVKAAREAKAIYDVTRESLLAKYNWSFSMARANLPALASVPVYRYANEYQLPVDSLRLVEIGDRFVGVDLTDYRGASTREFMIEGRKILTDIAPPLSIRYVKSEDNPAFFAATFTEALYHRLAEQLAEPLTQSETKRDRAEVAYRRVISEAIRANAIELPPEKLADDEWIMSRL
jgi:hypothetical protein